MRFKTILSVSSKIILPALLYGAPALAQEMPATAPVPKAIAAKPADICAELQKEWDAKPVPASAAAADAGKKLCADGKYAEGSLKLRQALGK